MDEGRQIAAAAADELETDGENADLARVLFIRGVFEFWSGHARAGERMLETAIEHARLAGDQRLEVEAAGWLGATCGPGLLRRRGDPPLGSRCPADGRAVERRVAACSHRPAPRDAWGPGAGTRAGRGRSRPHRRAGAGASLGRHEPRCRRARAPRRDLPAAERALRAGADVLDRLGERGILSTVQAYLADVLYALGRLEEADELAHASEESTAADDHESQARWRAARARVSPARCARRGRGPRPRSGRDHGGDRLPADARSHTYEPRRGPAAGRPHGRGGGDRPRGPLEIRAEGRRRLGRARTSLPGRAGAISRARGSRLAPSSRRPAC